MMKAWERLLRYTLLPGASDDKSGAVPSSECQWEIARHLEAEMEALGFEGVRLDEYCRLYGFIPSNCGDEAPALGFIAHMDLSSSSPSGDIRARVVEYAGGDVELGEGLSITADKTPALKVYTGKHLIVTDGRTLLGADDRAGVAEIMTMAERLIGDASIRHGRIAVAFTPDEEIGRGPEHFDFGGFGADFAYTVDGGRFGEISWENFNASSAEVVFHGRSVHPGSAKGVMVNAQLLAMDFFSMLPEDERPEKTEGYEGFYLLEESEGSIERARQLYLLRDHDAAKLRSREAAVLKCVEAINAKYGAGSAEAAITQSYRNMAEVIAKHPFLIDIASEAVRSLGGEVCIEPMRGGTDGAALSFEGLPCPNLGTGSHNHHGRMEFACCEEMERVVEQLIKIAEAFGRLKR